MAELILTEALSASVSGAISTSILFPLEVLKTKMQAETECSSSNNNENEEEEESHHDGEEISFENVTNSYDDDDDDDDDNDTAVKAKNSDTTKTTNTTTTTTTTSTPALAENDKITKKKKKSSNNNKGAGNNNSNNNNGNSKQLSMIDYATKLYDKEGLSVFYKGLAPSAFQSSCEKSLYFFSYTVLKEFHYKLASSTKIPPLNNLLLGYLSEWCHLPITLPLDCWTTQIQCQGGGNNNNHKLSSMQLLLILLSKGPKTWYKGIQAYYVLCLKPAIQYTIFEQVKAIVLANKKKKMTARSTNNTKATTSLTAMEAFLLGMVARAIATILTYPYLRAKVIMQTTNNNKNTSTTEEDNDDDQGTHNNNHSSKNTNSEKKIDSVLGLLMKMYNKDGLSSCYQGIGPEITRGVFSAALMLMIKEKIKEDMGSVVRMIQFLLTISKNSIKESIGPCF